MMCTQSTCLLQNMREMCDKISCTSRQGKGQRHRRVAKHYGSMPVPGAGILLSKALVWVNEGGGGGGGRGGLSPRRFLG